MTSAHTLRRYFRPTLLTFMLASGTFLSACENTPAEPTGSKARAASSTTVKTSAKKPQLQWRVPPTWTTMRTADKGKYRGKYQIPKTGDSKHPPELLITYIGKGKKGDVAPDLARWRADFQGEGIAEAKEEVLSAAAGIQVRVLELHGTYKFPLGPRFGKRKRAAATVLKKNWRGFGAAVISPKHGSWFFQLVGPNDAVAAAKGDFIAMMKALK